MPDEIVPTQEPVVTLTASAVRQVRFLMERRAKTGGVLRLGVKGGGCTGYSYVLRLDDAATERDRVYEQDGLTVAVDPKSARLLQGATLDYTLRRMLDGGWVWSNPNAGRSCGCGSSFAPAAK
jgi:iron-sulfur cluster assembly protein